MLIWQNLEVPLAAQLIYYHSKTAIYLNSYLNVVRVFLMLLNVILITISTNVSTYQLQPC